MLVSPKEIVAAAKASITETSAEAFHESADECVLIDIRDANEFAGGHIAGAVCSPRGMLEFNIHNLVETSCGSGEDAADKPIVLYCGTGARSALAAQCLESMGYRNVRSMAGGINAWNEAGLPLERES